VTTLDLGLPDAGLGRTRRMERGMVFKVSKTLAWHGFAGLVYIVFVTLAKSCTPRLQSAKGPPGDKFNETCFAASFTRNFALTSMLLPEGRRRT
jgi:hypothetical protein